MTLRVSYFGNDGSTLHWGHAGFAIFLRVSFRSMPTWFGVEGSGFSAVDLPWGSGCWPLV